jgi:hypothetical protein
MQTSQSCICCFSALDIAAERGNFRERLLQRLKEFVGFCIRRHLSLVVRDNVCRDEKSHRRRKIVRLPFLRDFAFVTCLIWLNRPPA